ncbi:hypothetical protein GTQ99_00485 [Kineococcus sp. T13]|uniref:hypothetical protein n=1 Tax=Kineococcus vitellinus TaxID=2696565 RepID=UPI001413343B|nr:hypothetical protein [Kineococcus vitellinus]NAZ73908.1 hypothetical protein [Kineococcus vitellinus]
MARYVPDDWYYPDYPAVPTVWDDDPNPVIGTLLDHRGDVLSYVRADPPRRMGY